MWPSKFCSYDSILSQQSSLSSLYADPSNDLMPTWNLELYPRRRHTEFYYEPRPMPEYQSRYCEHPQDKLDRSSSVLDAMERAKPKVPRIMPPRNSDMRVLRNSYFS